MDRPEGWEGVVWECEQIFGCNDHAKSPLASNLPNLIRDNIPAAPEHHYNKKGVCTQCGCSREAIQSFNWQCGGTGTAKKATITKKAIYVGSFDMLTNGHHWMISEGLKLFNRLVVGVGTNPDKKTMFPATDRIQMIKECFPNIEVVSLSNEFTVDYCMEQHDIEYILRGIRSEKDYEAERMMRHVNGDLNDSITTVFLIPPRHLAEVSSSMVKGMIGYRGWARVIQRYIPAPVYKRVLELNKARIC